MNAADLNDLLIFMAVVEAGSFVAGGKTLGLSRSAAGKAVARLETRFAARLLNRTTRAVSLTEEGRVLYGQGQSIREAMDAAERSMGQGAALPRGILRLTVPDAFGRRIVLPIARQFLADWTDMQMEISFSDHVANIVEDGFDLAIRIGVTEAPAGFISRTLIRERALLCAAPAYLAAHGEPGTVEQLSTHDLLFHAHHNQRLHWRLEEADGTSVRAMGRSRLRLDNGEALRTAALDGMGIALLPEFLVGEDIAAGRLHRVLPDVDAGMVPIVTLYPHKRLLEPRVRRFLDLLVALLPRRSS